MEAVAYVVAQAACDRVRNESSNGQNAAHRPGLEATFLTHLMLPHREKYVLRSGFTKDKLHSF